MYIILTFFFSLLATKCNNNAVTIQKFTPEQGLCGHDKLNIIPYHSQGTDRQKLEQFCLKCSLGMAEFTGRGLLPPVIKKLFFHFLRLLPPLPVGRDALMVILCYFFFFQHKSEKILFVKTNENI